MQRVHSFPLKRSTHSRHVTGTLQLISGLTIKIKLEIVSLSLSLLMQPDVIKPLILILKIVSTKTMGV